MNHKHIGPEDEACPGCIDEAGEIYRSQERSKTVAGLVILIALVITAMAALSWYLTEHGSHH